MTPKHSLILLAAALMGCGASDDPCSRSLPPMSVETYVTSPNGGIDNDLCAVVTASTEGMFTSVNGNVQSGNNNEGLFCFPIYAPAPRYETVSFRAYYDPTCTTSVSIPVR